MSAWTEHGLPAADLSIAELHTIAMLSRRRVQYWHTPDGNLLEAVRVILEQYDEGDT